MTESNEVDKLARDAIEKRVRILPRRRAPPPEGTGPHGVSRAEGPARTEGGWPDRGRSEEEDEDSQGDSLSRFIVGSTTKKEELGEIPEDSVLPRQPRTLVDLGLSKAFLIDLTLKIIHYSGTPSVSQLTRRLGLGPNIVQHLIAALTEERLIEVLSQSDLYTGNYRYRLSDRGHVTRR